MRKLQNKPTVHSYSPNCPYNSRTNWPSLVNMMPVSKRQKTFVQRWCQYAQLLPNQQLLQPSNQLVQAAEAQPKQENPKRTDIDRTQHKKKFDGTCRYCSIYTIGQNCANGKKTKQLAAEIPSRKKTQNLKIQNQQEF